MTAPKRTTDDVQRWSVELHAEREGVFGYRYRRVRVAREGRRAWVRTFELRLDWDELRWVTTPRRRLVRQLGRGLEVEEANRLWRWIRARGVERLEPRYPCEDARDPTTLDSSVGLDGRPVAVSLGEEGPACLTCGWEGEEGWQQLRSAVERRSWGEQGAPRAGRGRRAPWTQIWRRVDPGLARARAFRYRRNRPAEDLVEELRALKALHFLNLSQIEARGAEALGVLGEPAGVEYLSEALVAPEVRVRLAALEALAAIGEPSAAEAVRLACEDDDPRVRRKAEDVLDERFARKHEP